ncbi:hypothetical protein HRbin36_00879 [bacterium HR36]|nr:hypothetical protein HRbin36_00879 [bacterium HR36]
MNAGNDTIILRNINQQVNQILGDISINFGRGGASLWVEGVMNFIGKVNVLAGNGSFFSKWTNFSITGPVNIDATHSPRALIQIQVGSATNAVGQFSNLTIRTGRGNDTITLRGKFFENQAPPVLEPLTVGNNLVLDTGSGNDDVRTEFLDVLGSADLRLGSGADKLDMLEGQFNGTAAFLLGGGNDSLSMQGTVFQKGADILSGGALPDQDNISLTGLNINGNLKIITGDDDDSVFLSGTFVSGLPGTTQGQLSIQTGRGQDYVSLVNVSIARDMVILLGPENDSANFSYVDVGGKGTLDGGPGTNLLSRIGLRVPRGLAISNFP